MIMKKCLFGFILFCLYQPLSFAENEPLRVGIPAFSPPFVMQSNPQTFYGFDIATIDFVCKKLERKCEYYPMNFHELLPAIRAQQIDTAIGGIILTLKRSRNMSFSIPYLPSEGQFISLSSFELRKDFDLRHITKERIGILDGSAFERSLRRLYSSKNPPLVEFQQDSQMIESLRAGRINLALLSGPKARYWSSNAGGLFKMVGNPFSIGFGFVIAINPEDVDLQKQINATLIEYHQSELFKQNYNMYIRSSF